MQEIWKPVIGIENGHFDGFYEVSNLGRFKMLPRRVNCNRGKGWRTTKEKVINGHNSHGYMSVVLKNDGRKVCIGVHILVANAFIPNTHNKPTVNHIDTNRSNNNINNLEWATQQEQVDHAKSMGVVKVLKGEERAQSKLKNAHIRTIREVYKTGKYTKLFLSKLFSVNPKCIADIVNYKTWKHVA